MFSDLKEIFFDKMETSFWTNCKKVKKFEDYVTEAK